MDTFLAVVKDQQPDVVVFGGDMVNAGSISHWNRSRARLKEGLRLKEELDLLKERLIHPIYDLTPTRTLKVWLPGNHDLWVDQHIEEFPELEGMLSVTKYLGLDGENWKVCDYGDTYQLGKLHFMHGDNLGGKYHAAQAVQNYHRNIRYGHFHTYQVATAINPMDVKDFHTAVAVPCLANCNPAYSLNRPNSWINGFLLGEVLKSGAFQDQVVLMVGGKAVINGRIYG